MKGSQTLPKESPKMALLACIFANFRLMAGFMSPVTEKRH
jgi:hypothetical protein